MEGKSRERGHQGARGARNQVKARSHDPPVGRTERRIDNIDRVTRHGFTRFPHSISSINPSACHERMDQGLFFRVSTRGSSGISVLFLNKGEDSSAKRDSGNPFQIRSIERTNEPVAVHIWLSRPKRL